MSAVALDQHISRLLKQAGLYLGHPQISHLEGGLWNRALRIDTGKQSYVFKSFCEVDETAFFPNSANDEAEALKRLSGLGVSPKFVAFWPEENLLVYEYVSGETWSGDIAQVAKLLRRKEGVDCSGFRQGKLTPQALLAEGETMYARCNHTPPIRPTLSEISAPHHLSLIHRDIGPNNLVGSGEGLRLIDWQCPTQGDLTEDIYSFLSPAFHIVSEREPLRPQDKADFFQALGMPYFEKRYEQLAPFYAWRMIAYCRWREQTHLDLDIRQRYGRAALAEAAFLAGYL